MDEENLEQAAASAQVDDDDDEAMTAADDDDGDDNPTELPDAADDTTPAFINMQDVVEVQVDEDLPMEEEDDDDEGGGEAQRNGLVPADDAAAAAAAAGANNDTETAAGAAAAAAKDDSKYKFTPHIDAVYTVAAAFDARTGQLSVLSGGGDDKAFLYRIPADAPAATTTRTITTVAPTPTPIPYNFTDTVSSVAYNWQYNSDDLTKTPRLAAVGSYDGSILLYDTSENQTLATPKLQLEGPSDVEWMAFHPKGGTVLLVGSGDASVWMFHLPLNRCLQVFVGHEQAVTAGCFSPDGKWALSASADGTLRIWAPKTGMSKHVFRFTSDSNNKSGGSGEAPASLTCMATAGGSDGMLVMVGGEDGQAHVCHIGTKKVVATLRHFDAGNTATNHGGGGDDDNDEDMEYPMSVEAVGFSPSQPTWCATAGVDGKLKIWDLSRDGGQCRQVCVPATDGQGGAADSITRLQWHPTFPLVFTAHISGSVRLWDARSGSLVRTVHGGQEQINDMSIQFSSSTPSVAMIVTASDDSSVRLFELDVNAALQSSVASGTA